LQQLRISLLTHGVQPGSVTVTGGISIGLIIGPTVGGILYDAFGFAAAFYVSAAMALVAMLLVLLIMPETRGGVDANYPSA